MQEFKMNRENAKFISLEADKKQNDTWWLTRTVEERFYAIEFLRHQYMEMNGIRAVMDKQHLDII